MRKKKLLYLSGPMTGVKDNNVPLFNKKAKELRARGYRVINPPELDKRLHCATWEACLKRDLTYVVKCDAIATLPNWQNSRGARLEVYVGEQLGIQNYPVDWYRGQL